MPPLKPPRMLNATFDAGASLAIARQHGLTGQARAEFRRYGVKAAKRDDACALVPRDGIVAVDHVAHPGRLAGDVDIVGAMAHAGRHQLAAIQRKWPRRAQHHAGVFSQRRPWLRRHAPRPPQCRPAARCKRRARPPVFAAERPANAQRKPEACTCGLMGKIGHCLAADKAAGTVQHHVIRALGFGMGAWWGFLFATVLIAACAGSAWASGTLDSECK